VSTGNHTTPWRRIEEARPLRAWSAAQLAAIAHVLQGAQQAWCDAWGLPQSVPQVVCTDAGEQHLDVAWQFAAAAGLATAWIALPCSFDAEIALRLWGGDGSAGPVAMRVARACRADLQARLCAALQMDCGASPSGEPPRTCGAWSGVVHVQLAAGVRLLLDTAAVEHLRAGAPEPARRAPATARPLAPVSHAISDLRIALRARLADCELDLASLQDLRIGDIVPLPHRLDAPLHVRDAREELVFAGYLARRGQRKALELVLPVTPAARIH